MRRLDVTHAEQEWEAQLISKIVFISWT